MATTEEILKMRDQLIDDFAPEATDFVAACLEDRMTQNGYGKALSLLSSLPNWVVRSAFVEAMVAAGYPPATAAFLRQQCNLPGETDSQSVLMGLS